MPKGTSFPQHAILTLPHLETSIQSGGPLYAIYGFATTAVKLNRAGWRDRYIHDLDNQNTCFDPNEFNIAFPPRANFVFDNYWFAHAYQQVLARKRGEG